MKIEKRRTKSKKPTSFLKRFVIVIKIPAIFLIVIGILLIVHQLAPTVETSKTEMHKLPPDVKKELTEQNIVASSSATFRVPILLYHYVEYVQNKKDTIRQSLDINPNTFEFQVQTLVKASYTFMTAKELGDVIDGKTKLPKNPILLTFDDGHWDFDTVVLPILKKYHVKTTAYIISSFIGGSDFMTRQQLQEVVDSKLVEVGAHTAHHVSLKGKLLPIVQFEVNSSKTWLEQTYHISVVSFAYPSGRFDEQAINVVKDACCK